ncbi:MAG: SRPBCC family protein [Candidatus Obscuribacterales bacterium]|nr:SRPBCC family protein [Candidatus Obscuribacterales bacterium]
MKNGRRADLLSALIVMSFVFSAVNSPALAMKQSTVAHMGSVYTHNPSVRQEQVGERKYQVASVVIDSNADNVWTALTSYNRAQEIYSNLKALKILKDEGSKKRVSFSVAAMGGLWKYDYVLNITESKADKRIEWHRHSGAFKVNDGYWQLTPVNGGEQTLVTYAKFIDGGLLTPQAMINSELRKIMPEVLSNLRTAVVKEQIALSK